MDRVSGGSIHAEYVPEIEDDEFKEEVLFSYGGYIQCIIRIDSYSICRDVQGVF